MQLNRMTSEQLAAAHRASVESGESQLVVRNRIIMNETFVGEDLSMIRFIGCVLHNCHFIMCDARGWELEGKMEVRGVTFTDCGVSLSSFTSDHDVRVEVHSTSREAATAAPRRAVTARSYIGVRFEGKNFANHEFRNCVFIDCVFVDCDFTNVHIEQTVFISVWIIDSRVAAGSFAAGQDVHFIRTFRAEQAA